jgi:hypothetical protein
MGTAGILSDTFFGRTRGAPLEQLESDDKDIERLFVIADGQQPLGARHTAGCSSMRAARPAARPPHPFFELREHTLSTCCRLVSSFLTEMVQQIHSLRASGVMSSQAASAFASDVSAFRRSAGRSCTTPPEIRTLVMVLSRRLKEQVSDTRVQLGFRDYRRQSGHYPMFEFCPDSQ